MALQLGALRDALLDAGAKPEAAAKAAEEVAGYEARLAQIEGKLTAAMWAGGIMFVLLLGSQAALWTQMGKIDGQLTGISSQVAAIARTVSAR